MFKLSSAAGDAAAWAFNVSTSVAIVFCNKVLMDPHWGYKFIFGKSGPPQESSVVMQKGHERVWSCKKGMSECGHAKSDASDGQMQFDSMLSPT